MNPKPRRTTQPGEAGPLSLLLLVLLSHSFWLAPASLGGKVGTPSQGCLFAFAEHCLLESSFLWGAEGAERWPWTCRGRERGRQTDRQTERTHVCHNSAAACWVAGRVSQAHLSAPTLPILQNGGKAFHVRPQDDLLSSHRLGVCSKESEP